MLVEMVVSRKIYSKKMPFDQKYGYFEFYNSSNIPKCVGLNSIQLLELMFTLLNYKTEDI